MSMFLETSRGLTSPHGTLPLFVGAIQNVQVQPKLTAFVTSRRFSGISQRNILALICRRFGFVIAFIIILIGIIVNRTASFLTSIETSLLSWKSNLDIPFAPGSKFGLYMSLWCEEFLDRIGNTPPAKSPPTTIRQSSSPSPYTTLQGSPHCSLDSLASTSPGKGN